ncbi:ankyrin repeat domain-containing protein [Carboxylicivirga sp. M1479]|nr:ankyrin repeat domain-containing protein [Carboxylicivirga sp. M1479]
MMMVLVSSLLVLASCNSIGQKNNETKVSTKSEQLMDIHAAAFMGDVNTIKKHVEAGTDLNKKDQYGSTPLIVAATFNKVEVAKALIEGKADLNMKSKDGSTPLHVASFFCRAEIVKCLLKHGADKSAIDAFGVTALQSVSGSFADVKPIYQQFNRDLGALGFKLDYDFLEENRPLIAELLK